MTWKDKTCQKCVFQVAGECRRFPPSCSFNSSLATGFYRVATDLYEVDGKEVYSQPYIPAGAEKKGLKYSIACAEYAESLDDTSEFVQLSE